jgi:Rrf2 family transcriptional regulator, iron-sulfur cluster assembly transcription factor
MLSRASGYGIRAMAFLAAQAPGKLSGAREISASERIPKPFLWKVLHKLERKKLIRSFKGLGGGYELAVPARQIRLTHILAALGTPLPTFDCLFGLPSCEEKTCPAHPSCKVIANNVQKLFTRCTVADLLPALKRPSQRGTRRPKRRLSRVK